jgi:hypothetical protein
MICSSRTRVRDSAGRGVVHAIKPFAVDEVGRTPDGALLFTGLRDIGIRTSEVNEMIVATGLPPDLSHRAKAP